MFNLMLCRYFLIPSSIWFSQNCLSIAKTAAWIGNWKVFHLFMNRCATFLWCCHDLQPSTVAVFSLQPQSKAGSSCHLTSWHVFLPAKKRTRHGTRGVDSDSSHAYTTLNFVDGGIHVTLDNHHPTDLRYLCVQKTHTEDNHLFYPQVLMSLSWSPWVKVLIRRSKLFYISVKGGVHLYSIPHLQFPPFGPSPVLFPTFLTDLSAHGHM